MARNDHPAGTVYHLGDVEIDAAARCLRRQGKEYRLRPKSFAVLLHLLEHRGQAVTKQDLVTHVWEGGAVTDDVIVGCVLEIRKAIGDSGRNPRLLTTIPKVGYRLVATEAPVRHRRPSKGIAIAAGAAGLTGLLAVAYILWRPSPPVPRGEVGWWRLDEGAGDRVADSSGWKNHGRLAGEVKWISGIHGPALSFNGGFVEGEGRSTLPLADSPRTLAAWVRASSDGGDLTSILQYGVAFHGEKEVLNGSMLLGLDERGRAMVRNEAWGGTARGTSRLADNTWHHVAAIYEGPASNQARIFVDGAEEGSAKLARLPATARPAQWRIGRSLGHGTPFRGAAGDVRVLARPLSPAEVLTLYRCTQVAAGDRYLLPVYSPDATVDGSRIVNRGGDFAGVQFAQSDGACAVASVSGADSGQDIAMEMDIRFPRETAIVLQAGPYFRSRSAHPGDGLTGGTSAGYWVQLQSNGQVRIRRLNPAAVVAFTAPDTGFDAGAWHHLTIRVLGSGLQVWLADRLLRFDQGGRMVETVSIPSVWNGPPAVGRNDGAAGVAFATEFARGAGGGQEIANLVVSNAKP